MSQANGSKLSKQMLQFKSGGNFTSQPEMDNVVNNGLDSNNELCAIYPKFDTTSSALVLDSSSVEVVGGLDVAETLKTVTIQHSDKLRIHNTKKVVLVIYT